MTSYLMSDLHLDEGRPHLTDILVAFLRGRARDARTLYLLGDIFEYWIGDDDESPLISTIRTELKSASEAGLRICLMHGNRDFLIGARFAAAAGIELLPDPCEVVLGGIPTLLTHGDRYCTTDTRYMAFRAQVRSVAWQEALLAQPLEQRRALALKLRKESEANQSAQVFAGEALSDVVDCDIIDELVATDATRLIHGHTHRPANHSMVLPDGRTVERIVLADWRSEGEALLVNDDGTFERQVLALP